MTRSQVVRDVPAQLEVLLGYRTVLSSLLEIVHVRAKAFDFRAEIPKGSADLLASALTEGPDSLQLLPPKSLRDLDMDVKALQVCRAAHAPLRGSQPTVPGDSPARAGRDIRAVGRALPARPAPCRAPAPGARPPHGVRRHVRRREARRRRGSALAPHAQARARTPAARAAAWRPPPRSAAADRRAERSARSRAARRRLAARAAGGARDGDVRERVHGDAAADAVCRRLFASADRPVCALPQRVDSVPWECRSESFRAVPCRAVNDSGLIWPAVGVAMVSAECCGTPAAGRSCRSAACRAVLQRSRAQPTVALLQVRGAGRLAAA